MWFYKPTEPGLWTVGFCDSNGEWHTDSDHDNRADARARVHYLNGGSHQAESKTDDRAERIVAQMIFAGHKNMAFLAGRMRGFRDAMEIPRDCGVVFSLRGPEDRTEAVKMVVLSLRAGHVYEEVE